MLRLYNVDETPLWKMLDVFGYQDMERCLFLGFTDGEAGFSKNVAKNIKKDCLQPWRYEPDLLCDQKLGKRAV